MALDLQWDSDVCSLSHFHNLFEGYCSIFIKPNVQIVYLPGYYGPVIVCEALVSEAGLVAAPQLWEAQYR